MSEQSVPSADLSAREFNRRVADPERFSGGGSVAALAAAGAASAALLVVRLNARRRANAAWAETIRGDTAQLERLCDAFYLNSDRDLVILNQLLAAQRAKRQTGEQQAYLEALLAAAQSPMDVARAVIDLLQTVSRHIAMSSRFTVSDLAASAALAEGAARAALATAEINLVLLSEEAGANRDKVVALQQELVTLRDSVILGARQIERGARAKMTQRRAVAADVP